MEVQFEQFDFVENGTYDNATGMIILVGFCHVLLHSNFNDG